MDAKDLIATCRAKRVPRTMKTKALEVLNRIMASWNPPARAAAPLLDVTQQKYWPQLGLAQKDGMWRPWLEVHPTTAEHAAECSVCGSYSHR